MFSTLVMVSQVYAYVQTQEDVYNEHVHFLLSIKF